MGAPPGRGPAGPATITRSVVVVRRESRVKFVVIAVVVVLVLIAVGRLSRGDKDVGPSAGGGLWAGDGGADAGGHHGGADGGADGGAAGSDGGAGSSGSDGGA